MKYKNPFVSVGDNLHEMSKSAFVSVGDNLHEMSKPVFWVNQKRKYLNRSSVENLTQHTKR